MTDHDYPETEIEYSVKVDGERIRETFTTDDVSDPRAAWDEDVAEAYAQHLAVERHGSELTPGDGIDVNSVEITRLGEPNSNFDETGGTPV